MRNFRYRFGHFVIPFSITLALLVTLIPTVTYAQVSKQAVNTGGGGYWGPPIRMEPASEKSIQNNITRFETVFSSDMVVAGYGGMRNNGVGSIVLTGVTGSISKAYLYWHGPTNSTDPAVNDTVNFNGTTVIGTNIGFSDNNCWGYLNSQAYRADVTSLVPGNGTYTLSNFIKGSGGSTANVNGVSLIVFFDDGNPSNNHDFVIFDGNDSNIHNAYDDDGWNVTLPGINYASGTANIQMHVADGQSFGDAALILNGSVLVPAGPIFEGNSVPNGASAGSTNGGLWDIKSFDITSFLTPGLDTLTLTTGVYSDCLGLVVAIIDLPAGAAPGASGMISGKKFHDLNGNGVKDSLEVGLAGWTINLSGDSTASVVTDSLGNYVFGNLKAGNFVVAEVLKTGWVRTFPPSPGVYSIALSKNQVVTGKDFGNSRYGSIGGEKFFDMNGDGVKDASEPGLAGWTINAAGPVNSSAVTDDAGNYVFQNLTPGTYTLTETLLPGWAQTLPVSGRYFVTIFSGDNVTGLDFGNRQTVGRGNIFGLVFDDRNGNGAKDPNEPGLSGWRVQLSGPGGIATLTDANGNYAFSNIAAGTYDVTVFLPSGWVQTLPPGGAPRNVTVVTGGTVSGVDFGTRLLTGVEESQGNPTEYELYQNFPNPFNPTTRLSFYLPQDGYVALKVYNVLGIEVASIFEGRMSVGMHSLVWDAQDIPSGVYIYRLTAGTFSEVKKMILMK
jgi:hypothetical protein